MIVKTLGIMGLVAAGKNYFTQKIIEVCNKRQIAYYLYDADKESKAFVLSHKKEIAQIFGLDRDVTDDELKQYCYRAIFEHSDPEHNYRNYVWNGLKQELLEKREKFASLQLADGQKRVFIINAPLLLSSGWYALCDTIAEVKTDSDVRFERFITRDMGLGYDKKQSTQHFYKTEEAYTEEKTVDRTQFRTIIYKINNTIAMVDNHLELEAMVVLNTVFEDK